MPTTRFAATSLVIALAGAVGQSQGRPPETSVAGRVVDAVSGAGIDGATVLAATRQSQTWKSETSSSGQFRLVLADAMTGLRLEAAKAGYLVGYRGQLGPHDNTAAAIRLDVARGEEVSDVVIRLWPEGVISGTVADEQGAPVAGATVTVLSTIYTGAGPRWSREGQNARTDATGSYRIARLPPGSYVISVQPPARRETEVRLSPPSYYPASRTAASASRIVVDGGEQRADVTLAAEVKSGPLNGRLTGASGGIEGARVRLVPVDANGDASEFDEVQTFAGSDGLFHFAGVPDGRYRVQVCHFPKSDRLLYVLSGDFQRLVTSSHSPPGRDPINPLPDGPTWVADATIIVDDLRSRDIVVPVQPGARISGRVVFQGRGAPPPGDALVKVPIAIRPADGGNFGIVPQPAQGVPQSRIEVTGTFRTIGLPPGNYTLNLIPSSSSEPPWNSWKVSSILVAGREVLGKSLRLETLDISDVVVTVTDELTEIRGSVRDVKGLAAPLARIIVFPRDVAERQDYWATHPRRVFQLLPDRSGGFRASAVPGDYFVAAVTSLPRDWMAPEFLQSIAGSATSVRVTTGEVSTVSVTVRSASR